MFISKEDLQDLKNEVSSLKYEINNDEANFNMKGRIKRLEKRMDSFVAAFSVLMNHLNLQLIDEPKKLSIKKAK